MSEQISDEASWFERTAKLIREKFKSKNKDFEDDLETEQEYKERWRSIYIIYFTMFLISLGFSIIVTGVWPYLDKLDPTAGKEFMGYIVAANPFGQMLFSPLVGWWSNRLGSIRLPLLCSLALFTTSSAIYSSLELFNDYRKHWMLWTRFLVGVSSANIAACRSYLSAATRVSERTTAVSMISLAQVLGFIVGPAIQAAVVPLGDDGFWIIPNRLRLNMYTASGWINVIFSLFNMYLFLPHVFKEHKIAGREAMLKQGKDNERDTWKQHRPNYFATWTLIVAFFVIVFNFMLLETLGTPVTMDQFAWSKAASLKYMGILMSVGAILAIVTFASISPLCKRFSEVKVMIWGGFLFMVLGRAIYIPFNNDPPQMYDSDLKLNLTLVCDKLLFNRTVSNYETMWSINSTDETTVRNLTLNCGEDLVGCPSSQEWCTYTPAMTLTQFIIGYFLTAFGYPIGVTLIQTIFSKLLGPRPQGVWMGLMTGSGCLSRVMGPVFVTYIYEEFGTIWTFGLTTVMMVICLFWLLYFNKTLIPVEIQTVPEGEELKDINDLVTIPLNDKIQDD
ncbi:major facilitator superfamily domain-containing protein 8 [Tribolium castaneum]|uniref:major facilitator superfamily domain-containing protein 8 n=1 Tax=Tribolium castaneum TaxID=7070 RepID=UPI0030FEA6BB